MTYNHFNLSLSLLGFEERAFNPLPTISFVMYYKSYSIHALSGNSTAYLHKKSKNINVLVDSGSFETVLKVCTKIVTE